MAYDAAAVANYFLLLAEKQGKDLDPMKLQKLVYFAHGWYLALRKEPLIKDRVEAWEYGPVIPSLYHQFKVFGNGTIKNRALVTKFDAGMFRLKTPSVDEQGDTETNIYAKSLLDRIWEVYGGLTAIQLSNMTHEPGSPWEITWNRNPGQRHVVIPDELIMADFERRLQENDNAA